MVDHPWMFTFGKQYELLIPSTRLLPIIVNAGQRNFSIVIRTITDELYVRPDGIGYKFQRAKIECILNSLWSDPEGDGSTRNFKVITEIGDKPSYLAFRFEEYLGFDGQAGSGDFKEIKYEEAAKHAQFNGRYAKFLVQIKAKIKAQVPESFPEAAV